MLLAGFAAAMAVAGCARSRPGADVLVVLADRDVEGLDPHTAGSLFQTQTVLANLYEGLVGFDPKMSLIPVLAVSWSNADDRTWDFRLRDGVQFHTGGTLTADDVVFSLRRARDHPASVLRAALAEIEEVEALPPEGVRIRTREPDAWLLQRLREVWIVSRRCVEARGEAALATTSCGTGPYLATSRLPGLGVDLARFEAYWGGQPAIARARFLVRNYGDPGLRGLIPEGAHLIFQTTAGSEAYRRALKDLPPVFGDQLSVSYLSFDLRGPTTPGVRLPGGKTGNPFRDPRVRQAMALAIDYGRLRRELAEEALVATQLVAPRVAGFDPTLPAPRTDPEAARALLRTTPFADGFEVDLDMRETAARALAERFGALLAEDLAAIGILARLRVLSEREFFGHVAHAESSLYVLRFSCRTGDAQEFLDKWVHSRDGTRGYGQVNFSYDVDPVPGLDAEIEAARREVRASARLPMLQRIMRAVMEARLAIPLLHARSVAFLSPALEWQPRTDTFVLVQEVHTAGDAGPALRDKARAQGAPR